MNIRIEWFRPEHVDRAAQIEALTLGNHPGCGPARAHGACGESIRSFLGGKRGPFDQTYGMVASPDGSPDDVLGYALVGTVKSHPAGKSGGHAFLVSLAVDPAQRRRGIGSLLLAAVLDRAGRADGMELWATVPDTNAGLALQCTMRSAGRGRGMVAIPGARLLSTTLPPIVRDILRAVDSEYSIVCRFPAPPRVTIPGGAGPPERPWLPAETGRRSA